MHVQFHPVPPLHDRLNSTKSSAPFCPFSEGMKIWKRLLSESDSTSDWVDSFAGKIATGQSTRPSFRQASDFRRSARQCRRENRVRFEALHDFHPVVAELGLGAHGVGIVTANLKIPNLEHVL